MSRANNDTNSVIEDNTPEIQTEQITLQKYNRSERKNASFVIKNKSNGKYLKMVIIKEKNTVRFTDVELEQCSVYKYKSLQNVMGHILVNAPNMDIKFEMVYRNKGKLQTK